MLKSIQFEQIVVKSHTCCWNCYGHVSHTIIFKFIVFEIGSHLKLQFLFTIPYYNNTTCTFKVGGP